MPPRPACGNSPSDSRVNQPLEGKMPSVPFDTRLTIIKMIGSGELSLTAILIQITCSSDWSKPCPNPVMELTGTRGRGLMFSLLLSTSCPPKSRADMPISSLLLVALLLCHDHGWLLLMRGREIVVLCGLDPTNCTRPTNGVDNSPLLACARRPMQNVLARTSICS